MLDVKITVTARCLALGLLVCGVAGCQKSPPAPDASAAGAQAPATGSAATTAAPPAATPPPATQTARKNTEVCAQLTADEVSAVMGKPVIRGTGDGCDFGLDPSAKEKQLADSKQALAKSGRHAAAGDMNAFMQGMARAGAANQKLGTSMMNQLTLNIDVHRDDQTEDQLKQIYTRTGDTVRAATAPEQHGLNGVIQGLDEVSGVGDWAFATNVASVNMGMGFSIRGRLLEARKGPWHLTLSATIAPDPGAAALDDRLANLARAVIAKL